jgi:hypothetical protein
MEQTVACVAVVLEELSRRSVGLLPATAVLEASHHARPEAWFSPTSHHAEAALVA